MKYRKGFKYQLAEPVTFQTSFAGREVFTKWIKLHPDGKLCLSVGYAWDGTSGPVIDRKTNMQASGLHDALYQLMRLGLIPYTLWRQADEEFRKILLEDGAWRIAVAIDMVGLMIADGRAARPSERKKIYEVP